MFYALLLSLIRHTNGLIKPHGTNRHEEKHRRQPNVCSAVVESSERTEKFKSFLLDVNEEARDCAMNVYVSPR